MFSIPPPVAAVWDGTARMTTLLFAGVKMPKAIPRTPSDGTNHSAVSGAVVIPMSTAMPRSAPTLERLPSPHEWGMSRSPTVAATAKPAGSAVKTSPASSAEEPAEVRMIGTRTSGPNSTR